MLERKSCAWEGLHGLPCTFAELLAEKRGDVVGLEVELTDEQCTTIKILFADGLNKALSFDEEGETILIMPDTQIRAWRNTPERTLANIVIHCREGEKGGELFESHVRTLLEQDGYAV